MQTRLCILCCLLLTVANVAIGDHEAIAPPLKQGDEELVLGDWYQMDLKRGPIRGHTEGWLFKVNEQWLVLGAAKDRVKAMRCTWIPRDTATIVRHTKLRKPVFALESEYPRSTGKDATLVTMLRGNVSNSYQLRVIGVKGSDLVLEDEKVPLSSVLSVQTIERIRDRQEWQRPREPDNDDKRQDRDQ
jgi:hypothetical protein